MKKITNKKVLNKIDKPLVSVVIPVYNEYHFLRCSLNSVVNQTYSNYEVVLVDDCSSDGSCDILKEYEQRYSNIRVYRNKSNKGVSETAKKAIMHSKGDFIARMDADDIMSPIRLEKQVEYLLQHKKTVALGGQVLMIDEENRVTGKKFFPLKHEDIYKFISRFIPIQQATLMIARNRLPEDFKYYVDGMNTAEEVELFFKLFQHGKVENLKDVLLFYRLHSNNTSLLDVKKTFLYTLLARIKAVLKYNYKPPFSGIIITFIQAIAIMLLPRKLTLTTYKALRRGSLKKLISIEEEYKIPTSLLHNCLR
ncbi:glycosyltransferase [Patescibacteria group bacterium]|nr:glycosyltransferase [Patescibacteria group bacterium]